MRELDECTAEVFRRSEKRIKERRRTRKRAAALCIPLCLIITLCSVTFLSGMEFTGSLKANDAEESMDSDRLVGSVVSGSLDHDCGMDYGIGKFFGSAAGSKGVDPIDSFSFSLTWDCNGISSYDSKTGKLVKTTDATHPEDYVTTYRLTAQQKQEIYDLILNLDVTDYPDVYNPHTNGLESSPSMTLILSVNTDTVQKTITAEDIAWTYESDNYEGQKFLSVCKVIQDILTSTEEWQSLPDYEFFYD